MASVAEKSLLFPFPQSDKRAASGSALTGQNIICFAKDWGEDPTSCNHVLRELAKTNNVLWLNSISTRAPKLTSSRDIGKIWKKLASFFRGVKQVEATMWVYTPLVLPFHSSSFAVLVNRLVLRVTLAALCRKIGMKEYQLWTFVPTSALYVSALHPQLLVYYVTDNWSAFTYVDGERIGTMVEHLATSADVVFATSRPLVKKLKEHNPETYFAEHGVNYASFSRANDDATQVPADLAALPQPILGFYGLIEEWLDQDLIAYLADRHPEWTIALIGRVCVDTSRLQKYPNIRFLGRKPHSELPGYCKGFAVGLIPHLVNDLTINMNPIKLREYMSAGLQIVSTALPEVRSFPDHCTVADDYLEFEHGVVQALIRDSTTRRKERSEAMQLETWDCKVALLGEKVMDAATRKRTLSRK